MNSPILAIRENCENPALLRVGYSRVDLEKVPATNDVNLMNPVMLERKLVPRLTVSIEKVTPTQIVENLSEAEDISIQRILAGASSAVFNPANVTGVYSEKEDVYAALGILLLRCSNLIAARTRRGVGNVILMNEEDLFYLQTASTSTFTSKSPVDEILPTYDRWVGVGVLNTTISVYIGPIPKGKILVHYFGTHSRNNDGLVDSLGVYSSFNGVNYLTLRDNTETGLGNYLDYCAVVNIEDSER